MKIASALGLAAALTLASGCDRSSTVLDELDRQEKASAAQAGQSAAASEAFLAENKTKPGVITTATGLQYEVKRPGRPGGAAPRESDVVTVHYEGTLPNGTVFDSSYTRGEPAQFPVNGVIAGWTEALQLMSPGAEFRLVIPAELAYGARGAPPDIPPNQALVFKVELLSVEAGGAGR